MGKPIRLLNVALGAVALLIAGGLVKSWLVPEPAASSPRAVKSSQEVAAAAFSRSARPPLSHFDVLLEKNPFKQPPPPRPAPVVGHPAAPPPAPLPALIGTIFVDHERRAVLTDKGKGNIYSVGDEIAGGTLTAISEDRVLYKRGDTVSELLLKAPIQAAGTRPPAPAGAPAVGPSPQHVPLPRPSQVIEGAPTSQGASPSREERQRLKRLKREERRRQSLEGPVQPPLRGA